jgi:hypothetical protein
MQIGTHLEIPGIQGASDLVYDLPAFDEPRRVKVYLVPEALSADRYFISIKQAGVPEIVPPSRAKDTVLLVSFDQQEEDQIQIKYINPEVENA